MRRSLSPLLPMLACTLLYAGVVPAKVVAGEASMAIGEVQGRDVRSPREGQSVVVEGVVTGNFSSGLGGFFMQDAGDGDARTSDAVFVVHAEDALPTLRAGDRVRVHGEVVEDSADNRSGTMTTLRPERIEVIGRGEIARQHLKAAPEDWESLEGMWVQIDAPLTLSGTNARFGETNASFDGRCGRRPRSPSPAAATSDRSKPTTRSDASCWTTPATVAIPNAPGTCPQALRAAAASPLARRASLTSATAATACN